MTISQELIDAYLSTRFVTHAPVGDLEIRIGQSHPAVDRLVTAGGHAEWAFITAWNPKSVESSAEGNAAAQVTLEAELRAAGYRLFQGEGIPADTRWLAEMSVLVVGIPEAVAIEVGRRYGQNAIVVGQVGGVAELRLCDA